jgi:ABC transporter substrate binding protein
MAVRADVRHLVGHNEMVLGIDCGLANSVVSHRRETANVSPSRSQTSTMRRDIVPKIAADVSHWGTGQMALGIGRRELIAGLGSAALAWPNVARAQRPAIPVVGYLSGMSPDASIEALADFRRGLAETGYVEGQNLAIEYRWLEGRYDQIPTMLADLVKRQVSVIAVPNTTTAALAAKAATQTIPIVFSIGSDPVAVGLDPMIAGPKGGPSSDMQGYEG